LPEDNNVPLLLTIPNRVGESFLQAEHGSIHWYATLLPIRSLSGVVPDEISCLFAFTAASVSRSLLPMMAAPPRMLPLVAMDWGISFATRCFAQLPRVTMLEYPQSSLRSGLNGFSRPSARKRGQRAPGTKNYYQPLFSSS